MRLLCGVLENARMRFFSRRRDSEQQQANKEVRHSSAHDSVGQTASIILVSGSFRRQNEKRDRVPARPRMTGELLRHG